MTRRVLTIVGARPQFIKAAPVGHAIEKASGLTEVLVHTGQHYDAAMSEVFFKELGINSPAYNLGLGGGGHGEMTGRMLMALEPLMVDEKPDAVLVYGDTNSTLAGALTAAKLHIPVFHVEAGLRSFRMTMPEEINRRMTDHVSSLLFCPTQVAIENLKAEGIQKGVLPVGDVMYDSALLAAATETGSDIAERLGLEKGRYEVATVHRAENTDDPAVLNDVLAFLKERAAEQPVVLPLHPRTKGAAEKFGLLLEALTVVDPLGYLEMTHLVRGSAGVLTDSGGLQKEAYFHQVPCITLRDETEWVETVENGWNRLWKSGEDYRPRKDIAEYGEGNAAERIVASILDFLN